MHIEQNYQWIQPFNPLKHLGSFLVGKRINLYQWKDKSINLSKESDDDNKIVGKIESFDECRFVYKYRIEVLYDNNKISFKGSLSELNLELLTD